MKIQVKQESQVFKPVTLELTFDTAEELEMFRCMVSYDESIPDTVYPNSSKDNIVLSELLGAIHSKIVNIQED